jgi:hypothetical protein
MSALRFVDTTLSEHAELGARNQAPENDQPVASQVMLSGQVWWLGLLCLRSVSGKAITHG